MKLNETYKNGTMDIKLISVHQTGYNNISILLRNNNDYVVVNNFRVYDDNKCDWAFAYQYNIESLSEATKVFINKIS